MSDTCESCDGPLDRFGVCEACARHERLTAAERIRLLAGSFTEQDAELSGGDPLRFEGYDEALGRARAETGLSEAVVWGWADVAGARCALVAFDFRFLGGSMGLGVGEKVARAFDAARTERLPLVCVTASGGARMQEGMVSLVQMAKTAEARRRHTEDGLAQVTLLVHPTTGGVYASFASLADLIWAEPGALVGFAGPRVVRELTGESPPRAVHTAEHAQEHGLVDAIVPRPAQRDALAAALRSLAGEAGRVTLPGRRPIAPSSEAGAWERVTLARAPGRPKGPAILDVLLTDATTLRGDRDGGGDDPGVVVRVGALAASGRRVVAVAQDASGDGRIRPPGFRKVLRAIDLAGRLDLPVVTLIDTRGADPLPASEGGGVAGAIARTFTATLDCPTPTVAVLTGEGGSGGALAMAPCDRVLAWENAIFSVIAPEGAASILYRDGSRAPELAERLGITAPELVRLGIVDRVLGEPAGGAQADPGRALEALAGEVADELEGLARMPNAPRLGHRRRRWRRAGKPWLRLG